MSQYLGKCNIQHFRLYTICLTGYYAMFRYITCMRLNSSHLFFNKIYLYLKTQFPSSIKIEKSFQVKLKNIYNVSIFKVRVVEWCCWYLTFDSFSIWPPTLFIELSFCEVAAPTCCLEISCIIFYVIFPMMAFISEAYLNPHFIDKDVSYYIR